MNILSLKKLSALLIAPAFFLMVSKPFENTSFAGQWKLNEGKSQLGEFGARMAAKALKVDQKDNAVTIAREVTTFNGENTTRTETLTFDGKEVEGQGGFGNSKRFSSLKWSADGQSIIISSTLKLDFNGEAMEIKGTETWTKSADGKTLTLKTVSAGGPQGETTITAVYDKQ